MKIKTNDASHVDVTTTVTLNPDGSVSATGQKVLVDDTTGESANVGDIFPVTLSAEEQSAVNAAIEAALTEAITNAVSALPAATEAAK